MLPRSALRPLLDPFALSLSGSQEDCLLTYLVLLLRWNRRINLIAPASPEECVTRHIGESLYLSRWVDLHGSLLDIGSGAGFPGLALKMVRPDLAVTLLEPVAKKRAFLKEVARACQMKSVEVLADRLGAFAEALPEPSFDLATARAVGGLEGLIRNARRCLKPTGKLCLWLGHDQARDLQASQARFRWRTPIPIPLSRRREIWIGDMIGSHGVAPG